MLDIESYLKELIKSAFMKLGTDISKEDIIIERSKEKIHGDYATNAAMQMARVLHKAPKIIAEELVKYLEDDNIEKIEIAGPGFINFFIKQSSLNSLIETIVNQGEYYGDSDYGCHKKINVEFVSANPTGDLHLGHARGAAIGDCICRLYTKIGYDVTREYYVNDAGNQINNLAKSIKSRYHQILENDENYPFPEDGYHGEDIFDITKKIIEEVGDKYLDDSPEGFEYFKRRGTALELKKLEEDLKMFRVKFDVFSSELAIRNAGGVEEVLKVCSPYIYENEGATFLKTTAFSDDKDRVIIKSDGSYTYLLPDIAYHVNKMQRGFDLCVDCLGADHHGYIERMKSSLQMCGYSRDKLEIELIQMVRLFKDGAEYKMSKRTGNAVSMKELCEETSIDAVRYYFVSRAGSSHLDYDIDSAKKMESSNPVYYAQYAHARLCAIIEQGKDIPCDFSGSALNEEKEKSLLKVLSEYPHEVLQAGINRAPYKITTYIQKLATAINEFYTVCRVINRNDMKVSSSRIALCKACEVVLKNALELIGVEAPNRM